MSRRKSNILIIYCDQLTSFALGCYGNEFVKTPNIDRLAARGVRFEVGISNTPTCVPARSNILTGQYARTCVGSRHNEILSKGSLGCSNRNKHPDKTLPEAMKEQGCKTAHIGKWHIDSTPSQMGFDRSLVTTSYYSKAAFIENETRAFKVTGFSADFELKTLRNYVAENRNEPFFVYFNITAPHMPILDAPYQYSRKYDPLKTPLRSNVWKDGSLPFDKDWFSIYMWEHDYREYCEDHPVPVTALPTDDFDIRNLTALYYGGVTWADAVVGHVMDCLEENGLTEDTIILFSSDHGDQLGSQHLFNKARLYEESIRIPMIYSWPSKIKPHVNDRQVVSLIDVMPTLIDLAGGAAPDSVQGQSLVPLLEGKRDELDCNYAIVETPYRELGIRTMTHMCGVLLDEADRDIEQRDYQFFNIANDPYQQNNLAGTEHERGMFGGLQDRLTEYNQNTPRLTGAGHYPWVPGL